MNHSLSYVLNQEWEEANETDSLGRYELSTNARVVDGGGGVGGGR